MPAKRSAMRKIKDVLRLKFEAKLSHERIAAATGISKGAVSKYVQRAQQMCLGWPLAADMDEGQLEALLFRQNAPRECYAVPDFAYVHRELQRKGVTLQLLWEEYGAAHGERAYRYTQYCEHYRRFRGSLARSMRQIHRAGEKLFIDYSGDTAAVIDIATGEVRAAQIFVAVMGASKYAYAEATWTQTLPDWIGSHIRALEFLNGAPALFIPDNLKAAIKKACRYEPEATSTYDEFARHYGAAILPARPFRPKDKPAVEMSVLVVQRWILARLRNRQFFSLAELNGAIAKLLTDLNRRPFKKLPGCRAEAFEAIDRPALRALPATRYEYADTSKVKVNIDYHVEVERHFYSVPHALVGQHLLARYTATTVECLYKGGRVAVHVRSYLVGKFTTLPEHMPASHRKHMEWTPGRLLNWGAKIGPGTRAVVQWQFDHRPHPEQGYRACLGLLNLTKTYGEERLEGACRRALTIGCTTLARIKMILVAKLDQHPDMFPAAEVAAPTATRVHTNVRGANYFRSDSMTTDETTTTEEGDNDSCSSNPRSIN
jgi:transposase